MLAQPPVVTLVSSKTSAVNAGLLSGTETDDLSVLGIADGVGLGVLKGDGSDGQVNDGLLGELGVGGGDNLGEGLRVDLDVVASLRKGNTVDLAGLGGGGLHFC